jgi:hypothetical protein
MKHAIALACALPALLCLRPALAEVEGSWDLSFKPKPKISVTALGQPLKLKPQGLPSRNRISFGGNAASPGLKLFTSSLVSGSWTQKRRTIKGIPTQSMIEPLLQGYLQQGSLYGLTFDHGQLLKSKNRLTAQELKSGLLEGTFQHTSTWRVHLSQPKDMTVPVHVKMVAHFKGRRVPQPAADGSASFKLGLSRHRYSLRPVS